MAEVDYMAAEPRVTARDPVKVVGGKDGGGRSNKRERGEEKDREADGSEGFLFQISPDPQGTSVLVSSSTKKKKRVSIKEEILTIRCFSSSRRSCRTKRTKSHSVQFQIIPRHTNSTGCQITIWQAELTRHQLKNDSVYNRKHISSHSYWQTCFSCSYITPPLCCSIKRALWKSSFLTFWILCKVFSMHPKPQEQQPSRTAVFGCSTDTQHAPTKPWLPHTSKGGAPARAAELFPLSSPNRTWRSSVCAWDQGVFYVAMQCDDLSINCLRHVANRSVRVVTSRMRLWPEFWRIQAKMPVWWEMSRFYLFSRWLQGEERGACQQNYNTEAWQREAVKHTRARARSSSCAQPALCVRVRQWVCVLNSNAAAQPELQMRRLRGGWQWCVWEPTPPLSFSLAE